MTWVELDSTGMAALRWVATLTSSPVLTLWPLVIWPWPAVDLRSLACFVSLSPTLLLKVLTSGLFANNEGLWALWNVPSMPALY